MDIWEQPSVRGNVQLLAWLASAAAPPANNGINFYGYDLRTHPDLTETLDWVADGVRRLYFRNVAIPSPQIIEALGRAWQGMGPWFHPNGL